MLYFIIELDVKLMPAFHTICKSYSCTMSLRDLSHLSDLRWSLTCDETIDQSFDSHEFIRESYLPSSNITLWNVIASSHFRTPKAPATHRPLKTSPTCCTPHCQPPRRRLSTRLWGRWRQTLILSTGCTRSSPSKSSMTCNAKWVVMKLDYISVCHTL